VRKLYSHVPETIRLKSTELDAQRCQLENFIKYIGDGRGTPALGKALAETERRVQVLEEEVDGLQPSHSKVFQTPPIAWIEERLSQIKEVLEERTEKSALLLRRLLGRIRLEPTKPDVGRPYYLARTSLDTLALLDSPDPEGGSEAGSKSLRWWRRRESNPRPKARPRRTLHACPLLMSHVRREEAAKTAGHQTRKLLAIARRAAARSPACLMTSDPQPPGEVRADAHSVLSCESVLIVRS
jgi:hypothetical protein